MLGMNENRLIGNRIFTMLGPRGHHDTTSPAKRLLKHAGSLRIFRNSIPYLVVYCCQLLPETHPT